MTTSTIEPEDKERLAAAVGMLVRTFLVAGRAGAPAEGKLPFNPLNFHLLEELLAHGATRPSDLAQLLGVPRSTISSALSALERRGLVEKARDTNDGRAKLIALTAEGFDVAEAIKRQNRLNAGVLLALLDEDAGQYVELMERVGVGLKGLLEQPTERSD
ncbi:MAG: MarR family transcriptional regulator [Parvularculaceae bacterium]|nr:MarR family transcriptional regulator [Parvularculaceae bacterium]